MSWKSWIPGYGKRSVRKKLKELDKAGIGIPMIIILMTQKSFELAVKKFGKNLPLPLWLTFMLTAITVFILYVYDKQLKEKAEERVRKHEKDDSVEKLNNVSDEEIEKRADRAFDRFKDKLKEYSSE